MVTGTCKVFCLYRSSGICLFVCLLWDCDSVGFSSLSACGLYCLSQGPCPSPHFQGDLRWIAEELALSLHILRMVASSLFLVLSHHFIGASKRILLSFSFFHVLEWIAVCSGHTQFSYFFRLAFFFSSPGTCIGFSPTTDVKIYRA